MTNLRRLSHETTYIKEHRDEYKSMFNIEMVDDNMSDWKVTLYGPEGTLYEGYEFNLSIKLSDKYPYAPPSVKFLSPIKHININKTGDICLDILKDKWAASINMTSVIISIIVLLGNPNFEDPFDSDLANLYRTDKKRYKEEIKETNEKHNKKKE